MSVDWKQISTVIEESTFSDAIDEFSSLKNKVLKSTPEELGADACHSAAAWKFLVGFAAKKRGHRNLVAQVVRKLAVVPSWCASLKADAALHDQVGELHA